MSKATADYNATKFEEIKTDAEQLVTDYSKLKDQDKEMENIYLMSWEQDLPKRRDKNTKLTISPDTTNKLIGAQRLLITTEPQFSVPYEDNDPKAQEAAKWMEPAAKLMWQASGRLNGMPIENDVVLASLTFGRCAIGLVNLQEQLDNLSDKDVSKAEKRRLEEAVKQTPIMFQAWHPGEGRSLRDSIGLIAYLREYKTDPRKLKTEWPGVDFDHLTKKEVVVRDWYDLEYRVVWIVGQDEPFFMRKHDMPDIPIVEQITEGSKMFDSPEKQYRPFAYMVWKSGLDKRLNLALTALYTNIFAVASNAQFKHRKSSINPEKKLEVNLDLVGGVIELEGDEDFEPMFSKGAIDPSLMEAITLAKQGITESTIFDQALGEPLGKNAPFSMVALLHQAGRLPLATPQKMASWAIAHAMEKAFRWLKDNDKEIEIKFQGVSQTIDPKLIPDDFSFEVKLEVDLPADNLQNANAAQIFLTLKAASKRWVRENLMQIDDSDAMDEEIWSEEMAELLMIQLFRDMQAQEQQQRLIEQQQAMGAAGGMPVPGGPVPGPGPAPGPAPGPGPVPPQITGGRGGLTGEQQAQPGVPLQSPLPPR